MAIIDKLPQRMKERLSTMIAAALGLFLGLRYSAFFSNLLDTYLPIDGNLMRRGVLLIILTIVIVYISFYIEKKLIGGKK